MLRAQELPACDPILQSSRAVNSRLVLWAVKSPISRLRNVVVLVAQLFRWEGAALLSRPLGLVKMPHLSVYNAGSASFLSCPVPTEGLVFQPCFPPPPGLGWGSSSISEPWAQREAPVSKCEETEPQTLS